MSPVCNIVYTMLSVIISWPPKCVYCMTIFNIILLSSVYKYWPSIHKLLLTISNTHWQSLLGSVIHNITEGFNIALFSVIKGSDSPVWPNIGNVEHVHPGFIPNVFSWLPARVRHLNSWTDEYLGLGLAALERVNLRAGLADLRSNVSWEGSFYEFL